VSLNTWRNRLLLDLPMRMQDHDPVGGKTINRGRAGSALDAVFGAGVPTKIGHHRGYSLDGVGDYFVCSTGYQLTTGRLSLMLTFDGPNPGVADYVVDWETVGGDSVCNLSMTTTELRFFCGSLAGAANAARVVYADYPLVKGQVATVVGVYDGVNQLVYIDGALAATAVTPVAPLATSNPLWVGARTNSGSYWAGEIYHVGLADFALGSHQVELYHREMMERFHQI